MLQPLLGMEIRDIQAAIGPSEPPYRSLQVFQAIYRQREADLSRMTALPAGLRERLSSTSIVGVPEIAARYESLDGTVRFLLSLADGKTVETVLMPEPGRNTICISTQVGCPVDCKFCLTALLGLERNLSAAEIVAQVYLVCREYSLDPRDSKLNLVLMGQGEPLLNLPAVLKAMRILQHEEGLGISARRITLSTSGIIPKIAELALAPERPKLAISLNASTEDQRRELMPITKKYTIRDLIGACRAYPLRSWEKLTFEYVLLGGVNDSAHDARRVARMLANLNCKVNLIAWNPGSELPFETPPDARVAEFQSIVKRTVPCFVRKPRGRDVYAACGQLQRKEASFLEETPFPIVNQPRIPSTLRND